MITDTKRTGSVRRFPLPALDVQADLAEKHKVDSLLYCDNPWALQSVGLSVLWAAQS